MASLAEELSQKGYLSVNKLCKYLNENYPILGTSYPALNRMVAKGTIPGVQIGGQVRVRKDAIEHYINTCMEKLEGGDKPLSTQSELPETFHQDQEEYRDTIKR